MSEIQVREENRRRVTVEQSEAQANVDTIRQTQAEEKRSKQRAKAVEEIAELDLLLEEIDGLLEENAEEFIASYINAGGE